MVNCISSLLCLLFYPQPMAFREYCQTGVLRKETSRTFDRGSMLLKTLWEKKKMLLPAFSFFPSMFSIF